MQARVCSHRDAYLRVMAQWGSPPPDVAAMARADGTGSRLAAGPGGEDREAAFRGWYLVQHGTEHVDPCEQPGG
jgi:hypothetical protein